VRDVLRGRFSATAVTALLSLSLGMTGLESQSHAQSLADFFGFGQPARPAIGVWKTTVSKLTDVAAADPAWTATVAAISSARLTTGSIARATPMTPLPGPRLTGAAHALTGSASYYWQDQMTATGEHFNKRDMTAAHKTLPFGTRVRVTRVDSGDSVIVRINDRGPYKPGRIIDLSERAAEDLGMTTVGVTPVRLEVLGQ
jgi:rare lipoprotein A